MQARQGILVRTYIVFIGLLLFCAIILGKVLYIQLVEGAEWIAKADKERLRMEEIEAERGTIFSEDGSVLSTSVPEFDIYVDFRAEGMQEQNGKVFIKYIDSVANGLAILFKDKPAAAYKAALKQGFKQKDRYALIKRKVSFPDYELMKKLPWINRGRNTSGFIAEARMKRLYPFRQLANRTIGIARDSNKVGLESKYDKYLNGTTGKRMVRYISGGAGIPVEGTSTEPRDGYDVVTTLDVNIQDVAHRALERMMVDNEALTGTCIVMEVATGKVRAIANLGRLENGSYVENYNYALSPSEPGSTWKLTTLMAALEEKAVTPETSVNLESGLWKVHNEVVRDSEKHGLTEATVQMAFEKSSNVGMAKMITQVFGNRPSKYLEYIHRWHLDTTTGIDLPGEKNPKVFRPGNKGWSKVTLAWMSFGYNLSVTPMQTAMLYNAVANNGRMMKPYLVNSISKEGELVQEFQPVVLEEKICSEATLRQVKQCLEGVVIRGTATNLKSELYNIAGKTGTSLVADKGITYNDEMYQSSFAGYFPAEKPEYTVVVVIRNKMHAKKIYGGVVAGPVFKEVADALFAGKLQQSGILAQRATDSLKYAFGGLAKSLDRVATNLNIGYYDSSKGYKVAALEKEINQREVLKARQAEIGTMPDLTGLGLKDALEYCENQGWKLVVKGSGRIISQSILPGNTVSRGQTIRVELIK